jgi:hypothetical protein
MVFLNAQAPHAGAIPGYATSRNRTLCCNYLLTNINSALLMINLVNYFMLFFLVVHKLVHRIANISKCITTVNENPQ